MIATLIAVLVKAPFPDLPETLGPEVVGKETRFRWQFRAAPDPAINSNAARENTGPAEEEIITVNYSLIGVPEIAQILSYKDRESPPHLLCNKVKEQSQLPSRQVESIVS